MQHITLESLMVYYGLQFLYIYKVLKTMNVLPCKCIELDRHV